MSSVAVASNHVAAVQSTPSANWYAVSTRSRHERVVAHQLNSAGIATFLPSLVEFHDWSDRRKKVEMPLFPGYVFLHSSLTPELRRCVMFARGTAGFVTMQGEPVPIPCEQISTIQRLLSERANCLAHPYLKIGQRVRLRGGALDGLEGILTKTNGQSGLVVSIDNISRSLFMRIEGYCVEPA